MSKRLKACFLSSLAVAALFIAGCNWGSYDDRGFGDNLFVVHQSTGDPIIFNCTKNFGVSGRAKCALDLIWAECEQNDAGDNGWPYCFDATRHSHIADMEKAIEEVTGPSYDCLSFIEGSFDSAPYRPERPQFVDQPFDPGTGKLVDLGQGPVFETFWQGVKAGTFGCP
jgi:hypothetical protein